jgi:demethylmenaquinone methyltransferase/2-methoxy-6-polyprenyl-1,4-benzoquinol methylase
METHFEKQDHSAPLRDPVMREAIRLLDLPAGSSGLDAGCGIGNHLLLLAEAVGSEGHVTGLELFADFVTHARKLAESSGRSNQVSIQQGDVNEMPFDEDSFDWAWSVDCVGHVSIGEPPAGLREMARAVRPGGQVALLGYSTQMLLPGHPQLEARLNANASAMTAFGEQPQPKHHFSRALGWFHEIGLDAVAARTVVGTVQAPLDDAVRKALISLFGMLWGGMQEKMSGADREEFQRLTEPDSPNFILETPDYYAYFTYSVFDGRVAAREV